MKKILTAAVFAALAANVAFAAENAAAPAAAAPADHGDQEKCGGVAKAGANDCASAAHSCAGQAAKASDPKEWVYTPKGLCERLATGAVVTEGAK